MTLYVPKVWNNEKILDVDMNRMEGAEQGRCAAKVVTISGTEGDAASIQAAITALGGNPGSVFVKTNGGAAPSINISTKISLPSYTRLFSDGVSLKPQAALVLDPVVEVQVGAIKTQIDGFRFNCVDYSPAAVIEVGGAGATYQTVLRDLKILNTTKNGIVLNKAQRCYIDNVEMAQSALGSRGVSVEDSKYVDITRCYFNGAGNEGVNVYGAASEHINIRGNYFYNVGGSGGGQAAVYCSNGANINVERNHIDSPGFYGVHGLTSALYLSVRDNEIENCDRGVELAVPGVVDNNRIHDVVEGVAVSGAKVDVIRNKIWNASLYGMLVVAGAQDIRLEKNRVYDSVGITNGIHISGVTGMCEINKNRIHHQAVTGHAIHIAGGGGRYEIIDNKLFPGSGFTGVYCNGDYLGTGSTIKGNFIDGNAAVGIYGIAIQGVTTGSHDISVNECRNFGQEGIIYDGTGKGHIFQGNRIVNCGRNILYDGLYVDAIGCSIIGNEIRNSLVVGNRPAFAISEGGVRADWNNIEANTLFGWQTGAIQLLGANSQQLWNLVKQVHP